MSTGFVFAMVGAALFALGVAGVVLIGHLLRRILAFNLMGSGAFQAGAVLAAAAVLLHLVGLLPGWNRPGLRLRIGLAAGFALFLALAAALLTQGSLLQYPPAAAGALILLIESGLTVSLALILAGLFLFLSREEGA